MRYKSSKLSDLQLEIKGIMKALSDGIITQEQAADKILYLREEMEKVIEGLKTMPTQAK